MVVQPSTQTTTVWDSVGSHPRFFIEVSTDEILGKPEQVQGHPPANIWLVSTVPPILFFARGTYPEAAPKHRWALNGTSSLR